MVPSPDERPCYNLSAMANVYCFGDSITRGENDDLHGGWVDRLKRLFIAEYLKQGNGEVCVFNLGIGGETTRSLKERFLPELEARFDAGERSVVLLAYGANDAAQAGGAFLVPPEAYLRNLTACVRAAKKKNAAVLLLNVSPVAAAAEGRPSPSGKVRRRAFIERYNAELKTMAGKEKVGLIDVYGAFLREGVDPLFAPDGVHPNTAGHGLIYGLALAALRSALREGR